MSSPRLTVDLNALAANWEHLRAAATHAGCADSAAVVKANAYGLGLEPIARALAAAGCHRFFVATAQEGETLREILPPNTATIHVLSGPTDRATASAIAASDLIPTLNDPHQLNLWHPHRHLPAAIHIDTGMNRLGFRFDTLNPATFQGFEIALVMSHLACADTPNHPLNALQRDRCNQLAKLFPTLPTSFTNSAAAITGTLTPATNGRDIARLGIALYGGNPLTNQPTPVKPVATLDAPIISIRQAKKGETIGYGATHTLTEPTTLAVLAAGYADGIPLSLSGRGFVHCQGHRLPILGRISMDMLTINATPIAQSLTPATRAELYGPNILLDETATQANTIPYELLTRTGPRVKRRYLPS